MTPPPHRHPYQLLWRTEQIADGRPLRMMSVLGKLKASFLMALSFLPEDDRSPNDTDVTGAIQEIWKYLAVISSSVIILMDAKCSSGWSYLELSSYERMLTWEMFRIVVHHHF